MTTESALKQIVLEQQRSGMSPQQFYTALAKLARFHVLLANAANPSCYTVGVPNPIPRDPVVQPLLTPETAHDVARGTPSAIKNGAHSAPGPSQPA